MGIKEQFDHISKRYDQQRKLLLPCFDDFYHLPLEVLDYKGDSPRVLDIGAGTGLFTAFVLERYPLGKYTLIDLSDQMLSVARERFAGNENIKYTEADYMKHDFKDKFDIVISALSIHHLLAADKEQLYQRCFDWLTEDGILINADQVLSTSDETESMFKGLWANFAKRSLSESEMEKAYERVSYDNPSTLSDQMKWLDQAGFKHVDVLYKYYHFCVLYAKK